MTPNAAARDREAELLAVRPIALAGVEVDPGRAQPADGQIFELVADLEDPQRLAAEIRAFVLGRAREFELQGTLAGMAQPGCAKIGAGRRGLALSDQRGIDGSVDAFCDAGAVVVVQHQNGTSAVAAMRDISAP